MAMAVYNGEHVQFHAAGVVDKTQVAALQVVILKWFPIVAQLLGYYQPDCSTCRLQFLDVLLNCQEMNIERYR
eukprot:3309440-Amphidinium_carterae.1